MEYTISDIEHAATETADDNLSDLTDTANSPKLSNLHSHSNFFSIMYNIFLFKWKGVEE